MKGCELIPPWAFPLRLAAAACVHAYVNSAYRIRRFGELPRNLGPALVIANHQIEIDPMPAISAIALNGAWRRPFCAASARLLHEPGFMAIRAPWLGSAFNGVNFSPLFNALGFLPIENELKSRTMLRWAYSVQRLHGALPLDRVFLPAVLQRFGTYGLKTKDLFRPQHFARAQQILVKLSELRLEHRQEQVEVTRALVERDLERLETYLRHGAMIYVTPEGDYSRDGTMLPFRGIWDRLAPLAKDVYLAAVSYDPFTSARLVQIYRIARLRDRTNVAFELKRARPVTTSSVLSAWLLECDGPFTVQQAIEGVRERLSRLDSEIFVDPQLLRDPPRLVHSAIARMAERRILQNGGNWYALAALRRHPSFPRVEDIVAFHARFFAETIAPKQQRTRVVTGFAGYDEVSAR